MTGEDRKKSGDDDANCCDIRGVPFTALCGDDAASPNCAAAWFEAVAATGLLGTNWESRLDRVGVADSEFRCDRRCALDDILLRG